MIRGARTAYAFAMRIGGPFAAQRGGRAERREQRLELAGEGQRRAGARVGCQVARGRRGGGAAGRPDGQGGRVGREEALGVQAGPPVRAALRPPDASAAALLAACCTAGSSTWSSITAACASGRTGARRRWPSASTARSRRPATRYRHAHSSPSPSASPASTCAAELARLRCV